MDDTDLMTCFYLFLTLVTYPLELARRGLVALYDTRLGRLIGNGIMDFGNFLWGCIKYFAKFIICWIVFRLVIYLFGYSDAKELLSSILFILKYSVQLFVNCRCWALVLFIFVCFQFRRWVQVV